MINNFHGTSLTSASFYFYILEATAYVLPCSTCQHALMDRWVYAYLNVGNFRVHDFHWHTFKITLFFLLEHILNTWTCAHVYAYISIRKINNKAGKNYLVKTLSYFFWWGIFFFLFVIFSHFPMMAHAEIISPGRYYERVISFTNQLGSHN